MINYLVLSGGGPYGFITYGCLKKLNKLNYWKLDNIKSIYGTSVGGIIAAIISLNIEWDILDNYLLNRPWDKAFNNELDNFLICLINNNGIDGIEVIKVIMEPLLSSKNISINITLKDFYNITNIELYLYTTNINNENGMKNIELSYKSYPNMKLIDALACTSGYPLLFKPIFYENMCFLDGGIINGFPLINCIDNIKLINNYEKKILGIKLKIKKKNINNNFTNFMDYINVLIKKAHESIDTTYDNNYNIENIIKCDIDINKLNIDNSVWIETLKSSNKSKNKLINIGIDYANKYCLFKK
jgi:patatin-like phospholipase/acyl hydrolase